MRFPHYANKSALASSAEEKVVAPNIFSGKEFHNLDKDVEGKNEVIRGEIYPGPNKKISREEIDIRDNTGGDSGYDRRVDEVGIVDQLNSEEEERVETPEGIDQSFREIK